MAERLLVLFACLIWLLPQQAAAGGLSPCAEKYISSPVLLGKGEKNFMLWPIYDAALYAPPGGYKASGPFAFKLTYWRNISGRTIADVTSEEIRRLGMTDEIKLAAWHGQLAGFFSDVVPGTAMTGVRTASGGTVFCRGGGEIGVIKDPAFADYFFGIWLGENTSTPALRAALLGGT